jgi:hypothetical protein
MSKNLDCKPRVLVAVLPERNGVPTDKIFFDFMAIASKGWAFLREPYRRTDLQRNLIVEHFLDEARFTHLLMLDCDHRHPPDIVERLRARFEEDATRLVVAGLAFRRGVPFDPCMYVADKAGNVYVPADWEAGALLKVDIVGTAAIMMSREVFGRLRKPWFKFDYDHVDEDAWPGEDIAFSRQCMEAGIPIWVDTSVQSPHYMDSYIDENTFRSHLAHAQDMQRVLEGFAGDGLAAAAGMMTEADLVG